MRERTGISPGGGRQGWVMEAREGGTMDKLPKGYKIRSVLGYWCLEWYVVDAKGRAYKCGRTKEEAIAHALARRRP
ncbi:MAG: hypothetical protein KGL39_35845 [Patescibacteria group bacterium]|nr:hypothetical protein [Patescibacteria group bacterium]